MIKPRFFFCTLSLVAVVLTTSCAPAAATETVAAVPVDPPTPTTAAVPATEAVIDPPAEEAPTVQAVATSRGPNLEATDPTTVSLASGQLQLVEFFRFT